MSINQMAYGTPSLLTGEIASRLLETTKGRGARHAPSVGQVLVAALHHLPWHDFQHVDCSCGRMSTRRIRIDLMSGAGDRVTLSTVVPIPSTVALWMVA